MYRLRQLEKETVNCFVIDIDIEVYVYESLDSNISLLGNLTFFLLYFVNNNLLRRFCNINCTTEYFLLWTGNNKACLIIRCFVVDVVDSAAAAVITFISENLLPTERSPKELQI